MVALFTAAATNCYADPVARQALIFLRRRELEAHCAPSIRAVSLHVAPQAPDTECHHAIGDLERAGHIRYSRMYTGRIINVHLEASGRALADRILAEAGIHIEPRTTRRCLKCRKDFEPDSPKIRICNPCKSLRRWRNCDLEPLHV